MREHRLRDLDSEPHGFFDRDRAAGDAFGEHVAFQTVINYREYDVLPGGKALVMVFPADRDEKAAPTLPHIHAVLNWTEELQARVPTKTR